MWILLCLVNFAKMCSKQLCMYKVLFSLFKIYFLRNNCPFVKLVVCMLIFTESFSFYLRFDINDPMRKFQHSHCMSVFDFLRGSMSSLQSYHSGSLSSRASQSSLTGSFSGPGPSSNPNRYNRISMWNVRKWTKELATVINLFSLLNWSWT